MTDLDELLRGAWDLHCHWARTGAPPAASSPARATPADIVRN